MVNRAFRIKNCHIYLKKKKSILISLSMTSVGSTEEVEKPPESIRIRLPLQIRTYTEKRPLIMKN